MTIRQTLKLLAALFFIVCFVFACRKWAQFTDLASLEGHSRTSWHPNGEANKINITVRNAQGNPLNDVKIEAVNTSGSISARTDRKGQAELNSAEAGLLGIIINDVPVVERTGILKPIDLSCGLNVQVTLMEKK